METEMDEARWQRIKFLLHYAWDETIAARKSASEFVKLALEILSPAGRPYFERFVREELNFEHTVPITKPLKKVPFKGSIWDQAASRMGQPPDPNPKIPF